MQDDLFHRLEEWFKQPPGSGHVYFGSDIAAAMGIENPTSKTYRDIAGCMTELGWSSSRSAKGTVYTRPKDTMKEHDVFQVPTQATSVQVYFPGHEGSVNSFLEGKFMCRVPVTKDRGCTVPKPSEANLMVVDRLEHCIHFIPSHAEKEKTVTPQMPNQHHCWFCAHSASDAGEGRHPQEVVRELAKTHNFKILDQVPQSIADGWSFWIETADGKIPELPPFFRIARWIPIGQV